MIDTIPGTMTKEETEEATRKWQEEQDKFPGPITPTPPLAEEPGIKHNDFYERQQERKQKQEDYLRNGTG